MAGVGIGKKGDEAHMLENTERESEQPGEQPDLTPVQARVLGCLMEKQRTTPDAYPLTLNSLVQACNQKTSRSPIMRLEAGEVGRVINQLRDRGLIHASFTGRVERYDHKMASSFRLDRQQQALMCSLMLRGPQTEGELRINSGRMAEFSDLQEVAALLTELSERTPALIARLPRLPGRREDRFGHLLCGEIEQGEPLAAPSRKASPPDDRIAELEAEIARLRLELDALWELTGLRSQRPG